MPPSEALVLPDETEERLLVPFFSCDPSRRRALLLLPRESRDRPDRLMTMRIVEFWREEGDVLHFSLQGEVDPSTRIEVSYRRGEAHPRTADGRGCFILIDTVSGDGVGDHLCILRRKFRHAQVIAPEEPL